MMMKMMMIIIIIIIIPTEMMRVKIIMMTMGIYAIVNDHDDHYYLVTLCKTCEGSTDLFLQEGI